MLLQTESSVLAAIEDPEVRGERLTVLRRERAIARVATLVVVVVFFIKGFARAEPTPWAWC